MTLSASQCCRLTSCCMHSWSSTWWLPCSRNTQLGTWLRAFAIVNRSNRTMMGIFNVDICHREITQLVSRWSTGWDVGRCCLTVPTSCLLIRWIVSCLGHQTAHPSCTDTHSTTAASTMILTTLGRRRLEQPPNSPSQIASWVVSAVDRCGKLLWLTASVWLVIGWPINCCHSASASVPWHVVGSSRY